MRGEARTLVSTNLTGAVIFYFCIWCNVGAASVVPNSTVVDHFPRQPDLPYSTAERFIVLVSNTSSAREIILMSTDKIGNPLGAKDAIVAKENNEEEDEPLTIPEDGGHFEGDISGVHLTRAAGKEDLNFTLGHKWADAEIPYVISESFSPRQRSVILTAMSAFEDRSCVRWRPRRQSDDGYVHILRDEGCYSTVGRIGGPQILSLGHGCVDVGTIIHEMLHAAGFWHEQSRPDRDEHVTVKWENIVAGREDNFARYSTGDEVMLLDYDTGSVMHYGAKAFSRNGRPTIVSARRKKQKFGQRKGFSELDVAKLNRLYKCDERCLPDSLGQDPCEVLSRENGCERFKDIMTIYCTNTCGICTVATGVKSTSLASPGAMQRDAALVNCISLLWFSFAATTL